MKVLVHCKRQFHNTAKSTSANLQCCCWRHNSRKGYYHTQDKNLDTGYTDFVRLMKATRTSVGSHCCTYQGNADWLIDGSQHCSIHTDVEQLSAAHDSKSPLTAIGWNHEANP
ncbi:hypothetical protein M378DRAFT_165838 [Amanita muscaria Koide BX008]|uniref:Uncharacterized protein n=1 Tax=Amanita muscaria (strain Koide BX008) TaxID=946122 RepID=A0A0C2T6T3_AMAMK|nr:hypothetical protein M378DRAFT_165838 [Amanita muscaria Koide BX008]